VGDSFSAFLDGRPQTIDEGPVTAKVVRVAGGVYVVALDDDERDPLGPCRGPSVQVGDSVLLIWTDNDRPWIAQVDTQPPLPDQP